jgi:hypothetical protein
MIEFGLHCKSVLGTTKRTSGMVSICQLASFITYLAAFHFLIQVFAMSKEAVSEASIQNLSVCQKLSK